MGGRTELPVQISKNGEVNAKALCAPGPRDSYKKRTDVEIIF